METPIIREEVHAFIQACQAFVEFSRDNGLSSAEREAIGNFTQALGLNLHRKPSPDDPALAATLSNLPPIE